MTSLRESLAAQRFKERQKELKNAGFKDQSIYGAKNLYVSYVGKDYLESKQLLELRRLTFYQYQEILPILRQYDTVRMCLRNKQFYISGQGPIDKADGVYQIAEDGNLMEINSNVSPDMKVSVRNGKYPLSVWVHEDFGSLHSGYRFIISSCTIPNALADAVVAKEIPESKEELNKSILKILLRQAAQLEKRHAKVKEAIDELRRERFRN